ncbi:MAG: CHRD domain-containing protein [Chloroflexota bacterium]
MKKTTLLHIVMVLLTVLALTSVAANGGRKFTTTLTGAAEIPGPGDPDGSGTATITLNPGQGEVCWEIQVSGITLPATGAHIHLINPATGFGGVVVPLTPPDATGHSSGCTSADRDLIKGIIQNPEKYYVNVHSTEFPAGAVRGDLSK